MKKNVLWNMAGSVVNAFSTLIFTVLATRMGGEESGGLMSLAIGVGFVMSTVSLFEVRPFQSTDIKEEFSFSDYLGHRILTCLAMVVISVVYLYVRNIKGLKAQVIFLVCMFRLIDSFSDVYQGMFQQHERLDLAGKALTLRILSALLIFSAVLLLSKSLLWANTATVLTSILCLLMFDCRKARYFGAVIPKFSAVQLVRLTRGCIPLFLTAFITMYLANISKFQIDIFWPDKQASWNALFIFASVINLFSIFAFRPMLTLLAVKWANCEYSIFIKIVIGLCSWIGGITIIVVLGGAVLGIPVLDTLYGLELERYKSVLLLILAGGGFNAFANLIYYVDTVVRAQGKILLCDITVFCIALLITPVCVKNYMLTGAAVAYLITMFVRSLMLLIVLISEYARKIK